jgi:Fur family peroxide stress response transcriptional regulator
MYKGRFHRARQGTPCYSSISGDIVVTQEKLADKLKRWGIRLTPQRLAIAQVVIESTDHPSVQQIHERVSERFPYITLATVYSTLAMLQRNGLVQELPFQKLSRYDANLSPHANLVCVSCGKVVDTEIGNDKISTLREELDNNAGFEIASQRVDFYGWCSECAPQKAPEEVGAHDPS